MNERVYNTIKNAVELFCRIQETRTKEEAFLKGLYFGLGGEIARHRPTWELIVKNPDYFIPIEKELSEIHGEVIDDQIEVTEALFRELYETEGRPIPLWLKKK
jgi:hypothetical protein